MIAAGDSILGRLYGKLACSSRFEPIRRLPKFKEPATICALYSLQAELEKYKKEGEPAILIFGFLGNSLVVSDKGAVTQLKDIYGNSHYEGIREASLDEFDNQLEIQSKCLALAAENGFIPLLLPPAPRHPVKCCDSRSHFSDSFDHENFYKKIIIWLGQTILNVMVDPAS